VSVDSGVKCEFARGASGRKAIGGLILALFGLLLLAECACAFNLKSFLSARTKKSAPTPVTAQIEVTDLIPYAAKLSRDYYDLMNQIKFIYELGRVKSRLEKIAQELEDLSIELAFLGGNPHQNYNRLLYYNEELNQIETELARIDKSLSIGKTTLLKAREKWLSEKQKIPRWKTMIERLGPLSVERKALLDIKGTIRNALMVINQRLRPVLDVEQKVSTLRVKNHTMVLVVNDWLKTYKGEILERNAPSILSPAYFRQLNWNLWKDSWKSLDEFFVQQGHHMARNIWLITSLAIASALLTLLIYRSQNHVDMVSRWYVFTKHPFASSIFVCFTFFGAAVRPLPPGWIPAFQFGVILSVMHLVKGMFGDAWKWRVVNRLAILILVTSLMRMVLFPRPLLRLIVILIAFTGIFFCFWESCHRKNAEKSPLIVMSLRLGTLIFFGVVITEILGYAGFSLYLMNALLMTVFALLNVWMLYLVVSGFIEFVFYKSPFHFIRKNAEVIFRRVRPILIIFFSALFCVTDLVIWKVYATKGEAIQQFFSLGLPVGGMNITIDAVLSSLLVLYVSFLTSWTIQAVLLEEVLPRRKMELGSQLSISRLVHYGIVFIGFLIALRVLGFGLTNLTIIGGALGVGVGFGLQAIVNNFASGLILLFERPIKIGDTIQVDGEMAVVKRLGLRATIVQTLDNAEIVVPNSDIVTSRVTNWTLANRRVRVRIPVGVAYGSDVAKVREILLQCAGENSKVLKYPEPQALFLSFGDSALNFELRVWISEFMDSTGEVQNELNHAINARFAEAGIEIPFPQQDLHLRSVDTEAARALRDEKAVTSDK